MGQSYDQDVRYHMRHFANRRRIVGFPFKFIVGISMIPTLWMKSIRPPDDCLLQGIYIEGDFLWTCVSVGQNSSYQDPPLDDCNLGWGSEVE